MSKKTKKIPTSAAEVGERKAYRMTGNLSGTKSSKKPSKKGKKSY